jgi:general stress protein 26
MRNPEQTIGDLIDKQGVSFIASVDEDGFPTMKAMPPPRKREGIRRFWFTTNTSSMLAAQYRDNPKAASISTISDFSGALCSKAQWKR